MSNKTASILVIMFLVSSCVISTFANEPSEISIALQAYELRMAGKLDQAIEFAGDSGESSAQFELARCYFTKLQIDLENNQLTVEQKKKNLIDTIKSADKAISKAIKADSKNSRYYYWAAVIDTLEAIYNAHSGWTIAGLPVESIKAIDNYQRALQINPNNHRARQNLMGLYDRLPWYCGGSKEKAQKQLEILTLKDDIFAARAQCEIHSGKTPEEKLVIWEKVLIDHPDEALAHEGMAQAYTNAKQIDKAYDHVQKAVQLDSSLNAFLLEYANRCKRADKFQMAENALKQYLASEPAPPVILHAHSLRLLADIKAEQGDENTAAEIRDKANKLCSADIGALSWDYYYDLFTLP